MNCVEQPFSRQISDGAYFQSKTLGFAQRHRVVHGIVFARPSYKTKYARRDQMYFVHKKEALRDGTSHELGQRNRLRLVDEVMWSDNF